MPTRSTPEAPSFAITALLLRRGGWTRRGRVPSRQVRITSEIHYMEEAPFVCVGGGGGGPGVTCASFYIRLKNSHGQKEQTWFSKKKNFFNKSPFIPNHFSFPPPPPRSSHATRIEHYICISPARGSHSEKVRIGFCSE